jgi:hypothetical protein
LGNPAGRRLQVVRYNKNGASWLPQPVTRHKKETPVRPKAKHRQMAKICKLTVRSSGRRNNYPATISVMTMRVNS